MSTKGMSIDEAFKALNAKKPVNEGVHDNEKTLSDMVSEIAAKIGAKKFDLDDEDDSYVRIAFMLDSMDEDEEDKKWQEIASVIKNYCTTPFKNEYDVDSTGAKDSKYLTYKLDPNAGGCDYAEDNLTAYEYYLNRGQYHRK